MNKETLRMQMLAGIITEGQYKAKLNENIENIENITYQGGTEDIPHRKKIIVNNNEPYLTSETTKDEQQKIAKDLGVNVKIDQMYEPDIFAEILGYNSVQDLAVAIAKKHGVELTLDLEEDQYKVKLNENEFSRPLYKNNDNIFNIIDQQLLIDDIDDEGLGNNYFPDGTSRIPFKNYRGKSDYTDDQKRNFINYLIKMKDKGNEKAIKLYQIAKTEEESKDFIKNAEELYKIAQTDSEAKDFI